MVSPSSESDVDMVRRAGGIELPTLVEKMLTLADSFCVDPYDVEKGAPGIREALRKLAEERPEVTYDALVKNLTQQELKLLADANRAYGEFLKRAAAMPSLAFLPVTPQVEAFVAAVNADMSRSESSEASHLPAELLGNLPNRSRLPDGRRPYFDLKTKTFGISEPLEPPFMCETRIDLLNQLKDKGEVALDNGDRLHVRHHEGGKGFAIYVHFSKGPFNHLGHFVYENGKYEHTTYFAHKEGEPGEGRRKDSRGADADLKRLCEATNILPRA